MTRFNKETKLNAALIVSGLLISSVGLGVTSSKEFGVDQVSPTQHRNLDNTTSGQIQNQSVTLERESEGEKAETDLSQNNLSAFGKMALPYSFFAGARVDYNSGKFEAPAGDTEFSSISAKPFVGYSINENWTVAYQAEFEKQDVKDVDLDEDQTMVHVLGASYANEKVEAGFVYKTDDESDFAVSPKTYLIHGKYMVLDSLSIGANIAQQEFEDDDRTVATITSGYSLNPMWDFEGAVSYGATSGDDSEGDLFASTLGAYINLKDNVRLGSVVSYGLENSEVEAIDESRKGQSLGLALNANYRF